MNKEQYTQARNLLEKISKLKAERDEFIRSVDVVDSYYKNMDKEVVDSIVGTVMKHYESKIIKFEKEFENL